MATYATAQNIGLRSHQCDATAVFTAPDGTTAYALLDGIGSTPTIRDWTRTAARSLARAAARTGDAEHGLRTEYLRYAAEPDRNDPFTRDGMPAAAAVVAVTAPGARLSLAWCGDSRAYTLTPDGPAIRLTRDHNLRRVWPPQNGHRGGNRNVITSYLGSTLTEGECTEHFGHPPIETHTLPPGPVRLLLASDGAYEPYEDAEQDLAPLLTGPSLRSLARKFADGAVKTSLAARPDNPYADNATVLIADIPTT
ncbi:PP2C family protein-serine/threonine phosphatase [Streptomyces showdoensis]|uniref:Mucin-2 n=1 Tax=Streptomyces showdoensis TaxID=68268 RepID=A0A2P2GMR3_STREW|nr:hypothetical protein [Streptomyces showdoensis]KKZ72105.1 mucin-2 [Streptomyces showdoensis]